MVIKTGWADDSKKNTLQYNIMLQYFASHVRQYESMIQNKPMSNQKRLTFKANNSCLYISLGHYNHLRIIN